MGVLCESIRIFDGNAQIIPNLQRGLVVLDSRWCVLSARCGEFKRLDYSGVMSKVGTPTLRTLRINKRISLVDGGNS